MRIEAAVLYEAKSPLVVETLDLAGPGPGEVLIDMRASGVCHSDYHVVSGQARHDFPVVLGHEGAGVVAAVGEGVRGLALGDHVTLNWTPFCGACFHCGHGETHLCREYEAPLWAGIMPDGSSRLSKDGRTYRQLSMLATWAERAVVPEVSCVRMDPRVPFEVAALIGCAVTTGVGAVQQKAQVRKGDTVAVIGGGGVGLSIVLGARLAKARRIIVIDRAPCKEAAARSLGATDFLNAGPDNVEEVRSLTDDLGADHVFEAVGRTALQEMGLEMTRRGGQLVLVGMAGTAEKMSISGAKLTRDEKSVLGSIYGSAHLSTAFATYAERYLEGRLPVDQLIERRYPLAEINRACDDMVSGASGRGVIVFDQESSA